MIRLHRLVIWAEQNTDGASSVLVGRNFGGGFAVLNRGTIASGAARGQQGRATPFLKGDPTALPEWSDARLTKDQDRHLHGNERRLPRDEAVARGLKPQPA